MDIIVLAHGVCQFDQAWANIANLDNNPNPLIDELHYFKGIRTMLENHKFTARHSRVSWSAGVEKRARDMRANLDPIIKEHPNCTIHIIAHSMGGLDARRMLFKDKDSKKPIHERVRSLTTVSTPHLGSDFADWALAPGNWTAALDEVLQVIGLDMGAFKDLTSASCLEFNDKSEEFEKDLVDGGFNFRTYAGFQAKNAVFTPLQLSWGTIPGDNDGLVSVKSAKWKAKYFVDYIPNADHLNELGWYDAEQSTVESPFALEKRIKQEFLNMACDACGKSRMKYSSPLAPNRIVSNILRGII